MKNLLFLLSFFLFSLLAAQTGSLTKADVSEEMNKVVKAMEIYHPNAYHYTDSAAIATYRGALLNELPDQPTKMEAYRSMNKLVCAFGDGHTRVYANQLKKDFIKADGRFFPLSVHIEKGNILVQESDNASAYGLEGQQILSINGIATSDLLDELRSHASRETRALDEALLTSSFAHYLWLAYGWEDFKVASISLDSEPLEIEVRGVTYQELPKETKTETKNVSYRMIDASTAYLKVTHFGRRLKSYRQEFKAAFAFFARAGARELIIDVRNHDGGDSRAGKELARYFADAPFQPFAYSEWKATPHFKKSFKNVYIPRTIQWAIPIIKGMNPHIKAIYKAKDYTNARVEYALQKPYRNTRHFTGKVYLLMDNNTFSAGTCFAAMVKDYGMATIIGQESGNLANFHADGLTHLPLAKSGLRVQISSSYLVRPSGDETPEPVQPDVKIASNVDALTYTLGLIAK